MFQWITIFTALFACFIWGFGSAEVYLFFQDSNSIEQHEQETRNGN